MILAGQAAIEHLATELDETDPAESSHWRKYHSKFKFFGDRFEGLQGFGGTRPHEPIRYFAHRLMQRKFRRMGLRYAEFPSFDDLGYRITRRQGRLYDLDILRQVLTLALLREALPGRLGPHAMACVIGDGFATLTSLLLASDSCRQVVLVNLTRTLLVDLWYLRLWLGQKAFEDKVALVVDDQGMSRALHGNQKVLAVQASHHELIQQCPIDIAANIASMQEMDPPVIDGYFVDLRAIAGTRRLDFYCCNREEKRLPDGTMVRFRDYPWQTDDRILIDELCPWHQEFYTASPPFYRPYDGPIRHRLAVLTGTAPGASSASIKEEALV